MKTAWMAGPADKRMRACRHKAESFTHYPEIALAGAHSIAALLVFAGQVATGGHGTVSRPALQEPVSQREA